MEILETKQLVFLRNTKWDDPFEGFLVNKYCKKYGKSYLDINNSRFFLCCTSETEKDHIWRVFTPNKDGVRIALNINKIKEYSPHIYSDWIKYLIIEEINEEAIQPIINNEKEIFNLPFHENAINQLYFIKRSAFSTEWEYRFMITNINNCNSDTLSIPITLDCIHDKIMFDPQMDDRLFNAYNDFIFKKYPKFIINKSELYDPDKVFQKYFI